MSFSSFFGFLCFFFFLKCQPLGPMYNATVINIVFLAFLKFVELGASQDLGVFQKIFDFFKKSQKNHKI